MNHPSGLSDSVIEQISSVLRRHPGVKQAVLYGSRAKGNYRPGSDIDLSLFARLKNENLREHIRRVGQVFYEKQRLD